MLQEDTIRVAKDLIANNPLGVICTIDAQHQPWGSAVYLGCDNNFNLYFTTKSNTIKHMNMMQNSSVAVVFTNEQNQQTIQARGIASVVANTEEANAAADVLRHTTGKSLDWTPPLSKINAGSYQLYKIAVNYARISIFGDKRAGETPTIIEYRV